MITLIILLIVALVAAVYLAYIGLMFGWYLLVAFGDLIIFASIVWLLIKLFRRKK